MEYEEALAVRRHRRSFAQTYSEHPVESTMAASELLTMLPIFHIVAEMLPNLSSFSKTSHSVASLLQQLPVYGRWRMRKVHRVTFPSQNVMWYPRPVRSLAQLAGGLLATGYLGGGVRKGTRGGVLVVVKVRLRPRSRRFYRGHPDGLPKFTHTF